MYCIEDHCQWDKEIRERPIPRGEGLNGYKLGFWWGLEDTGGFGADFRYWVGGYVVYFSAIVRCEREIMVYGR